MKRREFFKQAGVSSVAIVSATAAAASQQEGSEQHDHRPLHGPLASAVVSFGQWKTHPPLDRFPNVPPPPTVGNHQLLPFEATIREGGAVMYVISGLHQVIVYDRGTRPEDIDVNMFVPSTGVPAGVPLINFTTNLIYRGPDPSLLARDRIETVHFPRRGQYLVICGVRSHFVDDGMFGWVRVLSHRDD